MFFKYRVLKEVIKNEVSYYNTKYIFRIMPAEATFCQKCSLEYTAKSNMFTVHVVILFQFTLNKNLKSNFLS